jgi:hypothetical protein
MTTPYIDLLEELKGEECLAIVVGEFPTYPPRLQKQALYAAQRGHIPNALTTLAKAKDYLNYDYKPESYGAEEIPPIYAWTKTRVISVHEYDGSTYFQSVPRNPINCTPSY